MRYVLPKRFRPNGVHIERVIREAPAPRVGIRYAVHEPVEHEVDTSPLLPDSGRTAPWDLRLWWRLAGWAYKWAKWYPKPRSFVQAHMGGVVPARTYTARVSYCAACIYRTNAVGLKPVNGEPAYCRGGNCGCGETRVARLSWKARLWNWHCPIGRFKQGSEVRYHGSSQ